MEREIIRKTHSVCPVCLELIDAIVLEKSGQVFLSKECFNHGKFEVLLSRNSNFYRKLEDFYFTIMNGKGRICEYEMWVTLKCDTDCAICHLGEETKGPSLEPSLVEIDNFVRKSRIPFFILSGGEPTCREDLIDIIRLIKKYHKMVTIHTNGLKIRDKKYLEALKRSGLDRINLQFDGFNRQSYKLFRGNDLFDIKVKVLENLKTLNMPTDLNITIAKNVNEKEIGEIIDYAVRNSFINSLNFFTICYLAKVMDSSLNNFIMPDELATVVEEATDNKINQESIFLFQKLHLAIKSFFNQRFCLYSRIYILFRTKETYEPIDKYLNLRRAEWFLDRYKDLYKNNRIIAKIFLILTLPFVLFRFASLKIIKELVCTGFSYILMTSYHQKSKILLFINFNTCCDPYKIDYDIVPNCQDEIISLDKNSGELRNQGRDGQRAIELEKVHKLKNLTIY
jgi:uncharacterized radical SAM superfamily Fe-S cluster-containing enzyme